MNRLAAATLAALPIALLAAQPAAAQQRVIANLPEVSLTATVTGKWVLDPRRCPDIREDVRDARRNEGRRDRREDRRDRRVVDCPAEAWDFVVGVGEAPKHPVVIERGRLPRSYRGRTLFMNGDVIGTDGNPVRVTRFEYEAEEPSPTAVYQRDPYAYPSGIPSWQQPPSTPAPTYGTPSYGTPTYGQPTYQAPTYQAPTYGQPTYQPAPSTAQPSQPSNYEIRNGQIIFLD